VEGQVLLWSGATTARARCGGAGAVVGAHIRAIGADDVERGVGLQWRACSGRQNGWSGRRRDCDSGHTLVPGRQAGRQAGRQTAGVHGRSARQAAPSPAPATHLWSSPQAPGSSRRQWGPSRGRWWCWPAAAADQARGTPA
jgi:hypothetical protein